MSTQVDLGFGYLRQLGETEEAVEGRAYKERRKKGKGGVSQSQAVKNLSGTCIVYTYLFLFLAIAT